MGPRTTQVSPSNYCVHKILILGQHSPFSGAFVALMHVMDALVSHSCLVVDLTDGGTKFGDALKLSKMWDTSEKFFDTLKTNNEIST